MSRRRAEGGFSLRTAFSASAAEPTQTTYLSAPRSNVPILPTEAAGNGSRLSFTLQGLIPNIKSGGIRSVAPPTGRIDVRSLSNAFARPLETSVPSNDATRLHAVIEDLTQRLRKTNDKIQQLENINARNSQSFASAQNSAKQKIVVLKSEMTTVTASEAKLRAELSTKTKVVTESMSEPFLSSVRSALEADEFEKRVVVAESKCLEMEERKQQLGADLSVLESKREQLIGGVVAKTEESKSVEELEDLIKKARHASLSLDALDLRRMSLEDDVAKFGALSECRREDAASALRASLMTNAKIEEAEANLALIQQRTQDANVAETQALGAAAAATNAKIDEAEANLALIQQRTQDANVAETQALGAAAAATNAKIDEAEANLALIQQRTQDANMAETQALSAAAAATNAKIDEAEANLVLIQQRTQDANVAETQALGAAAAATNAKIDEAEANLALIQQRTQDANVAETQALSAVAAAMCWMPVLPNIIEGPLPPSKLHRIENNALARVEMAASTAIGIPFHFEMDAPIAMGSEAANEEGVQQTDMVLAVVGDLTSYFKNCVLESEPLKHGVATDAVPVAMASA